ncbi:hypothetical protein [Companilactobacillus sp. FL22-1]|uniref:hypothetical protein n=1 Tax=Companilactobacillus sp. FL22-1 TaxID=3373892 RepID=UPI0037540459
MNFLIIAVIFILGLSLVNFGGHMKSRIAAKIFYLIGTVNILLAMYIAWPK